MNDQPIVPENFNPKDPFENCKLNRVQYAEILTTIVKKNEDGLVIALNNKWGTGKTTFVKMWRDYLELPKNNFKTIYFNSWENDYEDNPLVALLGELSKINNGNKSKKYQKLISKGAKLFSNIIFPSLKLLTGVDLGKVEVLYDKMGENVAKLFDNEIDEYQNRKKTIKDFRNSLESYVNDELNGKRLVFIVDELDRCRPNYAVSLLEQIKHFFTVKNIHFILSIDKEQLSYAVEGVYGSNKIDSTEYLRRFIDLEFSLPSPDKEEFYLYLIEKYNINEFFSNKKENKIFLLKHEKLDFNNICHSIFCNNQIELRKQEKVFLLLKISFQLIENSNSVNLYLFVFFAFLKIVHEKFYDSIRFRNDHISEIHEKFYSKVKINISENTKETLIILERFLLLAIPVYNGSNEIISSEKIESYNLMHKSKIDHGFDIKNNISERISSNFEPNNFNLEFTFQKLEFINGLSVKNA